ncbi:complement factor B-like [Uloborus diversus]|uniref:complement factor B-like n=1 Tax=Uloborus diversus TaxID=327109 RepID=UPI00240A401C|nr:complement factor B-like [Uloborus diversus]
MQLGMKAVCLFHAALGLLTLSCLAEAKKAKDAECPPYPYISLEHGNITNIGRQKFTFQCDQGYFLASERIVRCWKGKWSDTKKPVCLPREDTCSEPPPVPHSEMHGNYRSVGSSVLYMCHTGYTLLGDSTRTCLDGRRWTGLTPICVEESEPLSSIADRMKNDFITEMGNYSSDSVASQGRLLDTSSIKEGLELVILFDRSSSIDPKDFRIGKKFVKFLLNQFGVRNGENPTGTRAAVLTFGTKSDIIFNVDEVLISGPQAANMAIDKIEPNGGGTNMVDALTSAYADVGPKLRKKAKKAIFLVTDGEPTITDITPEDVARSLKDNGGFEIFTVGIGKGINRKLLSDLASEPLRSHVFILDKYGDLDNIMKIIKARPPEVPAVGPGRCGYVKRKSNYLLKWSWLAAIYVDFGDDLRFCSGVLICSDWVMTAASCFVRKINNTRELIPMDEMSVFVTLGEQKLVNEDSSQLNFYTTEMKIHPLFNPEQDLQHNLALLKLNTPAPMGRFRPACLPPSDNVMKLHLILSINASIAGWGLPPQKHVPAEDLNGGTVRQDLSTIRVEVAEKGECRRIAGWKENIFCAGLGEDTCIGDLGSPVVAAEPGTGLHRVLGILSGKSACLKGLNQYAELTKYIEWINEETNQCSLSHWMA